MKLYTLVLFLLISSFAFGQKMVVMEKFTNSFCGACAGASEVIKDIVKENPNTIWISHYKTNGWFDNPLANEDSWALWQELDIPGNPLGMVDRKAVNNSVILGSGAWANEIQKQLQEKYFANIDITNVTYDIESRELNFDAEILFDELPDGGPYRVSAIIAENEVWGQEQHSYFNDVVGHPLEGRGDIIWDYTHSNVVRAILDDPWGTEDVVPDNPELNTLYSNSYSYEIPDDNRQAYIKIVVILSQHDASDVKNRKILNAYQVELDDLNLQLISSTENHSSSDLIKISPNPTSEVLFVEYDGRISKGFILDNKGQVIMKLDSSFDLKKIDVSKLDSGVYNLSLEKDKKWVTQKFVISK